MKVAFCTCVQIGLSCIEAVHEIGGSFDLFITLNDHRAKKKSGRIYLNELASKTNTPLLKINHINDSEVIDTLKEKQIDWLFIIGWSQIASKQIIDAPKIGAVGAHPTLLPKGRGRAAVPWAILHNLDKTGVTFFKMDEGVDTGEILAQHEIPLHDQITATELYNKVNDGHVHLIKRIWQDVQNGTLKGLAQDESQATYWEGRTPEDGFITSDLTVDEVDRLVRATTRPYPGAFIVQDNKKVVIWSGSKDSSKKGLKIQCQNGIYIGTEVEIIS